MTAIEWTDATWNPTTGCSQVSPGCAHCYAETLSLRFGWSKKPWTPENAAENVVLHPERLDKPLKWRTPRRVFVNSMSDLFHELIPDPFIAAVFETMRQCPQHTFQVLTKRPERAAEWFEQWSSAFERFDGTDWPLPNVWLGVSIENARFTARADVLREIPAAVRFISAEPLLGSLVYAGLQRACDRCEQGVMDSTNDHALGTCRCVCHAKRPLVLDGIDWLIVGGESGPEHRPMRPAWARELRDACLDEDGPNAPDVYENRPAFFFKQWGGRTPKAGGRLLDGREWSEYPTLCVAPEAAGSKAVSDG